jgi:hypothetical protein
MQPMILAVAAATIDRADVPAPRANRYMTRPTAIEGVDAATVGRKILGRIGDGTVRIEHDYPGLSLAYDLDVFMRPTFYAGPWVRCEQTVIEVHGRPTGPSSIAPGPGMFAELAESPDVRFSVRGLWYRFRRAGSETECSETAARAWTVAEDAAVFRIVPTG